MYQAVVTRVFTRPLEGADNIQLGTCLGNQIIVGKDVADGTLGIFFPCDGQLSEGYCEANNLIRAEVFTVDAVTGETVKKNLGGMFEEKRRVKSLKLRGAKSDGYFATLESLAYTGVDLSTLVEGHQFTEINGHPICGKYYTPATLRAMKGKNPSAKKREVPTFPQHIETSQFRFAAGTIPEGSIIYISEKVHGTSGRFGNVPEEIELPKPGKIKALILKALKQEPVAAKVEYGYLNGTRRTILEKKQPGNPGFYQDETFRENVTRNISLHKGEIIYFEIAGFTTNGSPIMQEQDTAKLKDKTIEKRYGRVMTYRYGCSDNECRIWVYRITRINEDGQYVELPWTQVVSRCRELGLQVVPVIQGPFVYNGNQEELRAVVEMHTEGTSTIDPSHIREGVVVRAESEFGTFFIKNKSFSFGVLEGFLKEAEEYVDAEEIA
jgi:hypothetical protein